MQIVLNRLDGTGPVAGGIEIIDAQQPHPTGTAGLQPGQQGRLQIAEVQLTRGGWGITAADHPRCPQALALIQVLLQMDGNRHQKRRPPGPPIRSENRCLISPARDP